MPSPPEPGRFLADDEARRLLTTANIQMRRGQTAEAERTLQDALARLPHDAAAHELLGDLRLAQDKFDEARAAYQAALEREPGRATAEAKLARASLRQSETRRRRTMGAAYASEGRALVRSGAGDEDDRGRRARLAFFSALMPGLGQVIGGAFVKGGILIAVDFLGWLLFSLTADRSTLVTLGQVARLNFGSLGGVTLFALALLTVDWIYAVVDAAR